MLEYIVSLLLTVVASVVSHYICKRLDSKDNK